MSRGIGFAVKIVMASMVAGFVLTACGGASAAPLRVGVLTDCEGFFRADGDPMTRGAQLPFLQRGAVAQGPNPRDGISGINVAGRPVELVDGCVEGGEYTTIVRAARALIEKENVSAIVGGSWPGDGLVLRELARRYPDVAFVVANPGPREVTLTDQAPNLFRFVPDAGQSTAGLGTYAAKVRGWKDVAMVTTDREFGWGSEAAFLAEFCAAGGRAAAEAFVPWYMPADLAQVKKDLGSAKVDGVVILGSAAPLPSQLLADAVTAFGGVDRVLLGPEFSIDRADMTDLPVTLDGVVGVSPWPADGPQLDQYRATSRQYFPSDEPLNPSTVALRDGVEAVLRGLESLPASSDAASSALVNAMGRVTVDGINGPTSVDSHGQAVGTTRIVRYAGGAGIPHLTEISRQTNVDPTLAGRLPAAYQPRADGQDCSSLTTPP